MQRKAHLPGKPWSAVFVVAEPGKESDIIRHRDMCPAVRYGHRVFDVALVAAAQVEVQKAVLHDIACGHFSHARQDILRKRVTARRIYLHAQSVQRDKLHLGHLVLKSLLTNAIVLKLSDFSLTIKKSYHFKLY